jgi:mRNA interferase MazF
MPSFSPGDVVKVPFPYTDRATRQFRPALVVSGSALSGSHGLLWVVMITSAENRPWASDVRVVDLTRAGLPAPSVVRPAKIATIDARDATRLGTLAPAQFRAVLRRVRATLGRNRTD